MRLGEEFDNQLCKHEPGKTIFREGDSGGTFFLIKDGIIEVKKTNIEDQLTNIATLGPGDIFGEMALLGDESSRSATVTTQTEAHIWEFSSDQFKLLFESSETFRNRIVKILSNRLERTNRQLSNIEQLRELAYRSFFLLVALLAHLEEREEQESQEDGEAIVIEPSVRKLSREFDVDVDTVTTLLNNPTIRELEQESSRVRNHLVSQAMDLLKEGLDRLNFEIDTDRELTDLEDSIPDDKDYQAIHMAEQFYNELYEKDRDKLTRKKGVLRRDLEQLKMHHKRMESETETDHRMKKRLQSYIRGIQRLLEEKNLAKEE